MKNFNKNIRQIQNWFRRWGRRICSAPGRVIPVGLYLNNKRETDEKCQEEIKE
jgi:hypothetical protein